MDRGLIAEEAAQRKLVPTVGRETIRLLVLNHDLKPWREKSWCIAELDQEYVDTVENSEGQAKTRAAKPTLLSSNFCGPEVHCDRMEDVLAVYECPLNPAEPVVCLDEKPVTLHADVRPPRPRLAVTSPNGTANTNVVATANVFCAVEPKAGRHFTWPTPDRSADRFAIPLFELAMSYREAETIHPVMDNLNPITASPWSVCAGKNSGA